MRAGTFWYIGNRQPLPERTGVTVRPTNEPPDEGGGSDDTQTITVDVQPRKVSRVSTANGVHCCVSCGKQRRECKIHRVCWPCTIRGCCQ